MIRSRSFIPSISPSPSTIPLNAGAQERDSISSRLLCIFRPCPTSGGSKLWRYFCLVVVAGIVVYICIAQRASTPTRTKPIVRLSKRVTVVLNTFKRTSMMQDAIYHYSTCGLIGHIYIVWSEKNPPNQKILTEYAARQHPHVAFIQHPTDSLNNRFKPIEGPHDKAIFAADDDIRVPCSDLDLAYETWLASDKSIVGFMPRVHLRHRSNEGEKLVYRCWWNVWWHGAYSIVLTKAAFLSHDYFEMYTTQMPSSIRELVDKERNCEDIAMQFLASDRSNLPPIFVKGHLQDLGVLNGISTSKNVVSAGHMDKRSQCLNDLVGIYKKNPLIRSHIIVDSAANSWTNAPSTWMEYISSDLWKLK